VIAVIAILIGLLLPAVQKVRAASIRLHCQNNLHQIGLAAHQYHDVSQSFPPGMRYQNATDRFLMMSWLTPLLPYVEQQQLWVESTAAYQLSRSPFRNPPHVGLTTIMKVFVCPSDGRTEEVQLSIFNGFFVALTSYLGVEGRDLSTRDGVLFRDSHVRMADITDGTSQTLLVGERPASADFHYGWWYAGAGQRSTGSLDTVLGVEEQNILPPTFADCPKEGYAFGHGSTENLCDMFHFWSLHNGGANFLYCDGSVHFLPYAASSILPALASRAGGETVEVP
jgi:prepilin-type processing-associated H-X9-DG protein